MVSHNGGVNLDVSPHAPDLDEEGPGLLSVRSPPMMALQQPLVDDKLGRNDPKERRKPELDWSLIRKGRIYGRDQETEQLQEAFYRRITTTWESERQPELVLVSGSSGTGKTVLAKKALKELVEEHDGFYVVGKFDQMQTHLPYGPFVAALTQLAVVLEQAHFQSMEDLRQRIQHGVGVDACGVLCALVPALSRLLGTQQHGHPSQIALNAQQDRLNLALRKFFRVICSSDEPLVLVMDDLQWADSSSLQLLETLVSDPDETTMDGFLIVGICRSNEVPLHHNFAGLLRRLEDEHAARIVHIEVKQLPLQATEALLSEMLQQPPYVCRPLAEVVHKKCDGNVFYILQYLRTLHDGGLLVAEYRSSSESKGRDHWYWPHVQEKYSFQDYDVTDLVSCRIKRLPKACQQFLTTGAFVGAEFELDILSTLSGDIDITEALTTVMEEQMIVKQMYRPGKYAFAHDRIQQAAYSLVPEDEQAIAHLTLGRSLLDKLNRDELKENLFLVVNQLICGIPLLTSEVDKIGLAGLCLQAGTKATEASDFDSALAYFRIGTELLSLITRPWRDEYHLCLELFNAQAEAECRCGEFDTMESTLNQVLINSKATSDKIRAQKTRIYALGAQTLLDQAIKVGLETLASLGVKFPAKPRLVFLIPEIMQVQRILGRLSDNDILELPSVDYDNKDVIAAMYILNLTASHVYMANPDMLPFVILRMVRLSIKHGICDESCTGFASYGLLLCATGSGDEGFRYAKLGLRLLDRTSNRNQFMPSVYFLAYGWIAPFSIPIRSTFDELQHAISTALDTCDFEFASSNSYLYMINLYVAGEKPAIIHERSAHYVEMMKQFQHGPWLALLLLLRQLVQGLMSETGDTSFLAFNDTTESEMQGGQSLASGTNERDFQIQQGTLAAHRMVFAYHLGKIESALKNAKLVRAAEQDFKISCQIFQQYFYDGMSALEAAHHGQKRRHLSAARKALKKLEKLAKHCPENILHKVYLLRGEMMVLKGKKKLSKAIGWYEKAMDHAGSNQFGNLHALAYERAAVAYQRLDSSNSPEAVRLMSRAIELYQAWGAAAIVSHLKKTHNL